MQRPFEHAVRDHGAALLRVCRAVAGPADADDAWQDTMIAAMRAWPDLDEDANVEAWLVTIAHRKAIDHTRARGRRPVPAPERDGALDAPGPADAAVRREADAELWSLVAALPPKQRQCVAYHYLGELSHAEVAAIVGGTEAAARRAAADGLKALRGQLRKELP